MPKRFATVDAFLDAQTPEQPGATPAGFAGDPDGLLSWRSDIRATLETPTAAELPERRAALIGVIRAWLAER